MSVFDEVYPDGKPFEENLRMPFDPEDDDDFDDDDGFDELGDDDELDDDDDVADVEDFREGFENDEINFDPYAGASIFYDDGPY